MNYLRHLSIRSLGSVAGLAIAMLLASAAQAQTYAVVTNLLNTGITSPAAPATIAQGRDGNVYSSGLGGGTANNGGAFSVSPSGVYSTFYNVGTADLGMYSGVTLGTDGFYYAALNDRGVGTFGTVFKLSSTGVETVLHSFANSGDGAYPVAPPMQAADGNYYGVTSGRGFIASTLYKITAAGVFSTIHTFSSTEGSDVSAGLIQGTDGNLYGCAISGGTVGVNAGTIFKATTVGVITVLHNFNSTDGTNCAYSMVQGSDGKLYGTANAGGNSSTGVVFKITTAGSYSVLHDFITATDGTGPVGAFMQASDGNFYGVTLTGGSNSGLGTVYKITANGAFTVLYTGVSATGSLLDSGLYQHTNGILYGVTNSGGTGPNSGNGVVYSLNISAAPFAKLVAKAGKVGSTAEILGQGFTGASKVTFGGVTATSFAVTSDTYMTAVVPTGAKTGVVTVTRPSGPLTTLVSFKVLPTVSSISPASGPVGTLVTVNGTGLTQTTKVTIGTILATSFTVVSDSKVTVTVPTGAKTGKVAVTTTGGTVNSASSFSVTPTISSFTPASGPVGTIVTIMGTGLTQTTKVTFGGVTATGLTVNSDSSVTATVPTGAVTGKIVVTSTGGTATSATNFTVN